MSVAVAEPRQTISWWRTSFGDEELRSLKEAIAHEHVGQGPVTRRFEAQLAEMVGVPYALATPSGSMALLLALLALGIGRDDEVIVPNRAWIAVAHAVMMLGARVVLVDVQPDVPVMDVSLIRRKLTARTKAIVPVHLNGRAVDLEAVKALAREYGLLVIEDAAQALFSKNAQGYLGTQSDIGCFSLSPAKVISTGQGGVAVTRSHATYEKLQLIRSHGVADLINVSYTQLGFNFKFPDLLAAVGLAQLARVGTRIDQLHAVYAKYATALEALPFLKLIPVNVAAGEVPLYVEVICPERERLIAVLRSHGIQARPFYPDLSEAEYVHARDAFPHSHRFSRQGVFLPCGPDQPLERIDRVVEVLRTYQRGR